MGRILSIDLGERRVGLAISDENQTIAQGLNTINHKNEDDLISTIKQVVNERRVGEIVIGYPISLSGNKTKRSNWVEDFQKKLEKIFAIPVNLFDERLTSQLATRFLEEANQPRRGTNPNKTIKNKRMKQVVDKLAATIILQDYLKFKKRNSR